MDAPRLHALLDVGRSLISELDPDAVLQRLLAVARELTGARYAAIGVLDERREELERFVTTGIDEATQRMIGDLPRGRGVLGVLIESPEPLRISDVGAHPRSYGFPPGHPPMSSFLGVPIVLQGEVWGNLYLTEKEHGDFTEEDEEAAIVLAEWAAIAIRNARLYRDVQRRRDELERANRALETTTEVSRALGGVTDLQRALELAVKRSRALLGARAAELALIEGDEVVVAAAAGEGVAGARGERMPLADSLAATVLKSGRTKRFDEVPETSFAHRRLGARRAIVTPLVFRDRIVGVLMMFDRLDSDEPFTVDDERLLDAFAASAATAVATAQMATDEALQKSIRASEEERRRWARELHDETLQELGGLRVLLGGARSSGDVARLEAAVDEATELIGMGIENLRSLITDLRPAALDELGAAAALEALAQRVGTASGLHVEFDVDLAWEAGRVATRHTGDVESTIYRVVQEALTNAVKLADAERVQVTIVDRDDVVEIEVRDDGRGFDPSHKASGFGLLGMRERLAIVHGVLRVESAPGGGTTVRARIPVVRRAEEQAVA